MAVDFVKRWALAVSIAIVFNLFVNYGLATFYKEPMYEAYCNSTFYGPKPVRIVPPDKAQCPDALFNESLENECAGRRGYIQYNYNASGCPVSAFCETCNIAYEEAGNRYHGNVFIFLVVVGVAAIIAGLIIGLPSVGIGFLLAGIISIIVGTFRNWGNLTDVVRFIVLGIVLAVLIFAGVKKVK
ncbi:phage holin family protein [Candidatus Woesearchaeota archaeon]|nr:phage holin family protein [Candidatus Woesearchaeota archaeon]